MLCKRKSKRQRQKQSLTNSNMKQRAGHLAAARPPARSCLCVRAAGARAEHLKSGRESWEKAAEKEREVQEVAGGVQGSVQPAGAGDVFRL